MVEQEILFLGLLLDRPKHGYDIKRQIQDELHPFLGLEVNSIYYPLKKLEELGLITKKAGREGNWPQKRIYSITSAGKKRFEILLTKSFLSVERPYFQMNLSLYFLQYVDQSLAKRRLKARLGLLGKVRVHLLEMYKQVSVKKDRLLCIVQHDLDMCEAEIQSISRLINTI